MTYRPYIRPPYPNELYHHGVKGMKWHDHIYAEVKGLGIKARKKGRKLIATTHLDDGWRKTKKAFGELGDYAKEQALGYAKKKAKEKITELANDPEVQEAVKKKAKQLYEDPEVRDAAMRGVKALYENEEVRSAVGKELEKAANDPEVRAAIEKEVNRYSKDPRVQAAVRRELDDYISQPDVKKELQTQAKDMAKDTAQDLAQDAAKSLVKSMLTSPFKRKRQGVDKQDASRRGLSR